MPYKSKKQERFFHTDTAKKAGITEDEVKEFDQVSKGKDLPETAKGACMGCGLAHGGNVDCYADGGNLPEPQDIDNKGLEVPPEEGLALAALAGPEGMAEDIPKMLGNESGEISLGGNAPEMEGLASKIQPFSKGVMGKGTPNEMTIWGVKGDPEDIAKLGYGKDPASIPEHILRQHGILPEMKVDATDLNSPNSFADGGVIEGLARRPTKNMLPEHEMESMLQHFETRLDNLHDMHQKAKDDQPDTEGFKARMDELERKANEIKGMAEGGMVESSSSTAAPDPYTPDDPNKKKPTGYSDGGMIDWFEKHMGSKDDSALKSDKSEATQADAIDPVVTSSDTPKGYDNGGEVPMDDADALSALLSSGGDDPNIRAGVKERLTGPAQANDYMTMDPQQGMHMMDTDKPTPFMAGAAQKAAQPVLNVPSQAHIPPAMSPTPQGPSIAPLAEKARMNLATPSANPAPMPEKGMPIGNDMNDFFAQQAGELNKFTPTAQSENQQKLLGNEFGLRGRLQNALAGAHDDILQGVARAGTGHAQENLNTQRSNLQENGVNQIGKLGTEQQALVQQRIAVEGQDPNSLVSQGMRDLASRVLGKQMPPTISGAALEKMIPGLGEMYYHMDMLGVMGAKNKQEAIKGLQDQLDRIDTQLNTVGGHNTLLHPEAKQLMQERDAILQQLKGYGVNAGPTAATPVSSWKYVGKVK